MNTALDHLPAGQRRELTRVVELFREALAVAAKDRKAPIGLFHYNDCWRAGLLDILRRLARPMLEERNISVAAFTMRLADAANIDLSAIEFHNASGAGRFDIGSAIEAALDLPPLGRAKASP